MAQERRARNAQRLFVRVAYGSAQVPVGLAQRQASSCYARQYAFLKLRRDEVRAAQGGPPDTSAPPSRAPGLTFACRVRGCAKAPATSPVSPLVWCEAAGVTVLERLVVKHSLLMARRCKARQVKGGLPTVQGL